MKISIIQKQKAPHKTELFNFKIIKPKQPSHYHIITLSQAF